MRARAPQYGGADQTSNQRQHRRVHDDGNGGEFGLGAEP